MSFVNLFISWNKTYLALRTHEYSHLQRHVWFQKCYCFQLGFVFKFIIHHYHQHILTRRSWILYTPRKKWKMHHSFNLLFSYKECQNLILLFLFFFLPKPIGFICKFFLFWPINTVFDFCKKCKVKLHFIELSSCCDGEWVKCYYIKTIHCHYFVFIFICSYSVTEALSTVKL